MLNIALWKKLPYEIRLVIYVSLLNYSKRKEKFNIVLKQLLDINCMNYRLKEDIEQGDVSTVSDIIENQLLFYTGAKSFSKLVFCALSIENWIFTNFLQYIINKDISLSNNRLYLLYDDYEMYNKKGNLKLCYFHKLLKQLVYNPFNYGDICIFMI